MSDDTKRILVVENSQTRYEFIRAVADRFAQEAEMNLPDYVWMTTASEGLDAARKQKFDLTLVGVNLTEGRAMDGLLNVVWPLCVEKRGPVIAMSGSSEYKQQADRIDVEFWFRNGEDGLQQLIALLEKYIRKN